MCKQENDMDVLDFGRLISMLTVDTPITNIYDKVYGQKKDRWWMCQREHFTVWCLHQPTCGTKKFQHKPNRSARYMYNHIGRPEMLLWLLEALGEKEDILIGIINEIVDMQYRKACSTIVSKITFDRILELIKTVSENDT